MNAGTFVGYVTKRDGSPISGAKIWIAGEFGDEAELKPAAKTDSRGYFQLIFADNAADIAEVGGKLSVSVGAGKGVRGNSKKRAAENCFQVKGYLVTETVKSDA